MDAQTVRDKIAGYTESSSGALLVPEHVAARPSSSRAVFYMPDGSRVEVDPDLPPIPAGLAHLDAWAGRAVPYIAWTTASGTIDLEDVDGTRYLDCIREGTCAMCALPLGYWKAWLIESEGEPERAARVMTEPGMHRPCAKYAQRVWWQPREWMLVARDYERWAPDKPHEKRPVMVRIPPAKFTEHLT